MMPFALLGVFLVDMSSFSLDNSLETLKQLLGLWREIAYYLGFVIALELVLRVFHPLFPFREKEEKTQAIG